MDPITALGAVGSIFAIVDAAGKLATRLHRVARGLKAAKKDVKRFAMEVSTFSDVLMCVFDCLRDHDSRSKKLEIIDSLKWKRATRLIAKRAALTIGDIKEICPRMKDLKSLIELWEKFKWLQRKSDVAELRLQMISLGAAVNMLMACISYEDKKDQGVDPMILRISLRQIKNCSRAAEEINARHMDAVLQNSSRDSLSAFFEIQDVVTDVYEEMEIVEIEKAAAVNSPEPDSSHLSRSRRSPRPYRNAHSMRRNAVASSRHAAQSKLALRLTTGDGPSSSVPADPEPPPAPASSDTALVHGTFYPQANTNIQQGAARRRRKDSTAQIPDDDALQESSDLARNLPSTNDSYEIVTILIMHPSNKSPIPGYRGWQTNAWLYRNLDRNIISQNHAVTLDLDVDFTSAKGDNVMAMDWDPTNPIVGHVQFVCNDGTVAFPVRCLVSRHRIHGATLMLGRPYIEQMEKARNGRRGESSRGH